MKVQTRREAVILMTAIPLLSTDAVAQPGRLDALFDRQTLLVPSRVRQRYAILAYYIQLLNLQVPIRSGSEDIAAAIKTYQLVGESIARSDARFEGEVQESFVQSLRQAFLKSQEELWAFLRQVGIDPRLLAASVIEESLASNMLFYGAETRVTNVIEMIWCGFPFCFRRPTKERDGMKRWTDGLPGATKRLAAILALCGLSGRKPL